MHEPEAVLLNGLYGVGKSTLAAELADRLEAAGVHYAALDLDWLGRAWADDSVEGDDHPTASPLLLENLALVVGNLRRRGNDRYVLAGSIADTDELDLVRATLAMPLRVVLVTASMDAIRARIESFDPTPARLEDIARSEGWASGVGPNDVPADLTVSNDGPLDDAATTILDWLGWVPSA